MRVEIRADLGPYHASSSIPGRRIYLDAGLLRGTSGRGVEFERILIHEIFHFVWVRLSNARRREWERLLAREFTDHRRGELGWSAEWRKNALRASDIHLRTPRWRRYACESFCDTAAWIYSGVRKHEEFTLSRAARAARRRWFVRCLETGGAVRF